MISWAGTKHFPRRAGRGTIGITVVLLAGGSAIAAWLIAPSPRSRGLLSDLGFGFSSFPGRRTGSSASCLFGQPNIQNSKEKKNNGHNIVCDGTSL